MKQVPGTTATTTSSSPVASTTRDEIAVCQILLDLRDLVSTLSESLPNFNWGCRRRRSCLDPPPPPLPPAPTTDARSQPPVKPEDDAASPDTPLSFSPSESDEKFNRQSKKTSRKRSWKELVDAIEELTQRKDLLAGEIQNVKKYYMKLMIHNSQLKAIKQEVLNSRQREDYNALAHNPLSMEDPTVRTFQHSFGPMAAQYYGLGSAHRGGPLGIDLNIPAEDAFEMGSSWPLDVSMVIVDRRARFAEARRRRRGLIKIKAMRNACGIKLPTTR